MYNSGNTIVSDKTLVMEQEKQYYAFISYKSEDIEWAIRMFSRMPSMALSNEKFYVYRMQRDGSITSTIDYKHICNFVKF